MEDLIALLEQATDGSIELDRRIAGYIEGEAWWIFPTSTPSGP